MKKIISIILCAALVFSLAVCTGAYDGKYKQFDRVLDMTDTLSSTELSDLEEMVVYYIEECETDFQFYIIEDLETYDLESVEDLAVSVYNDEDEPGGYGDTAECIVTVILADDNTFDFVELGDSDVRITGDLREIIMSEDIITEAIEEKDYYTAIYCLLSIYETALGVGFESMNPNVIDLAGVLSDDDITDLQDEIDEIGFYYDAEVLIFIDKDSGSKDALQLGDMIREYYLENGFGYGENSDGIALAIDIENRCYYIAYFGLEDTVDGEDVVYIGSENTMFDSEANNAIDDAVYNELIDDDNYSGACFALLDAINTVFEESDAPDIGFGVDLDDMPESVFAIAGAVAAFIISAMLLYFM